MKIKLEPYFNFVIEKPKVVDIKLYKTNKILKNLDDKENKLRDKAIFDILSKP